MLKFLLTSWWFYIPIIGVLLYLTHRNNQKIKTIKARQTDQSHTATHQVSHSRRTRPKSARVKKAAGKLGLSGAASHIRRSK